MTHYFDSWDSGLHKLSKTISPDGPTIEQSRALDAIEEKLVFDCTVAAEWPTFPEDLRDAIHKTILRYGVSCLPVGVNNEHVDTTEDHVRSLANLSSNLHTHFHTLAMRGIYDFNDSPLTPLRQMYAKGEERREQLAGVTRDLSTE